MTDQATTRNTLLTQLHLCSPVNKHARYQTTAEKEPSLYAAQTAIEYSRFYMADIVMAKNRGSTVLCSKVQVRRTAGEWVFEHELLKSALQSILRTLRDGNVTRVRMNGRSKRKCEHLPTIDIQPAAVATITIIVLTTVSVTASPATAMLRRSQDSNTGNPRMNSVQQRYIPI